MVGLVVVGLLAACGEGGGDSAATKQGKCAGDVAVVGALQIGNGKAGDIAWHAADSSLKNCASRAEWLHEAQASNWTSLVAPEQTLDILCQDLAPVPNGCK